MYIEFPLHQIFLPSKIDIILRILNEHFAYCSC